MLDVRSFIWRSLVRMSLFAIMILCGPRPEYFWDLTLLTTSHYIGAPTVAELKAMKKEAADANVEICMGYNKNVCKYVRKAREFASTTPGSHVTFVSNNTYENNAASLGECFERNAEGMLKNMAIHELALLASFYDVTVDNIESITADKEFSSLQTLRGPRYVYYATTIWNVWLHLYFAFI